MTEANKELPNWQKGLIHEYDDLRVKVNGLNNFICSVTYQGLDVNHQILMKTQLLHMRGYLATLGYRIDLIGIAENAIENARGGVVSSASDLVVGNGG